LFIDADSGKRRCRPSDFWEAIGRRDPRLPGVLHDFLAALESLGVYPDLKASLNPKADLPDRSKPINLGYITKNGQLWTNPAAWETPECVWRPYMERLASLIGGTIATGSTNYVSIDGKSAPRIEQFLPAHQSAFVQAIADILHALAKLESVEDQLKGKQAGLVEVQEWRIFLAQEHQEGNAMLLRLALLFLLTSSAGALAAGESNLKGAYDLWEDFEGGKVCNIKLDDEQTIGGFVLEGDEDCFSALKLGGDPYAWFLDSEGQLVVTDATRKVLARFAPVEGGAFYFRRTDAGLESLSLTPAD